MFGVNFAGPGEHKKYADKFNFNFPLLSDPECKVSAEFGCSLKPGSISRHVIVIDTEGKIAWIKAGMPTDDEILAEVAKAKR